MLSKITQYVFLLLLAVSAMSFAAPSSTAAAQGRERFAGGLNGTWSLDPTRSDDVDAAIERAVSNSLSSVRERMQDSLRRRLEAPDTLAIEQRGRSFTMASTRAPQVMFEADGQQRVEQIRNRSVRVEASLSRNQLTVSSMGDRGSDYRVTFASIDRGQRLRVTRSIYSDQLAQPVVVSSVYDKSSDVAQLDLYTGGTDETGLERNARGPFSVPNETQLVAVLDNDLSTRMAQPGDPFTMTVRSPSQFDGAVIEGTVVNRERSGRLAGRAQMSLNFERIRLPNGGTHSFAGYIESIRTPNGDDVRVNSEGVVRDTDSQTGRTVTRGGIGAALGAIIGAIGGGGKGAAIGAAVGAGVGAGSVYVQGRDDLELRSGTEVTIRASAPQAREALR